jgi:RNA polymerase sigma-70 factor (ECF subfamily)
MERESPHELPPPELLSDEQAVARICRGESELFELIMRRHNQRLYRAARAILRDEAEAEDVMREAYVRAFAHLDDFAGRASFKTWLTRIAVHEALARRRRRARDGGLDEAEEAMGQARAPRDPETLAAGRELGRLLEAAIDELPEAYRAVFVLREVDELSTADCAEVLELSEDVVKQRLHRARERLRDELYARAGAAADGAFAFHRPRCDRVVAAVLARIGAARRV